MKIHFLALAIFGPFLSRLIIAAQFIYPDENSCTTPKRTPGICINLKLCPELLNLLQQKPLTQQAIKHLQQSQCGFDQYNQPIVCCDSSLTTQRPPTTEVETSPFSNQPPNVQNHPNLNLLDHDSCGPIKRDKIIGGNRTSVNEFPWMALLAYRTRQPNPEFRCGGTVITNRYILTAAHCVTALPSNLQLIGIRIGEHDLTTEIDCDGRGTYEEVCTEKYQDFGIDHVIHHPLYSRTTLQNDVAVIRTDRVIDFRPDNSKPICLPIGSAAKVNTKKLAVTGWGVTELGISSQVMLKVSLPFYSMEKCAKVYKKQTEIWYKQVCMGGEQGRDSCSGDSGGPLQGPTVYFGHPRYVQYGIVSFGVRNCGTENFPGVYTRVEYYLDWILDSIRD